MKLYSFVDNHDVDRIISKIQVKDHIFPIYTLLFTLPGIPSIYYGSEWGIEGRKEGGNDDPLRPAVEIEEALNKEKDSKIMQHVKWLGNLHKKYTDCLAYGRYRELLLTNRQYAFVRFTQEQGLVVAVNNDEQEVNISIPVPFADKKYINLETEEQISVEGGRICLTMKAAGSVFVEIKE
jgi:cyclomaltodextrinase